MEFVEVDSVKQYNYEGPVYDLEVEEDHTYTINDYSVHNSAAGSLVNYLIGITNVDPLKHDLLFERFLDLQRTDLPDIDTDFEPRIRNAVIKYMIKKFGRDNVVNIGTFGLLKIKSAIQDVSRVCGIPPSEVFPVTKRIPQDINDITSLEDLEEKVPNLRTFLNKYDSEKMPIRWFINGVRGAHRQPGSHAAGVLVSSENLTQSVALIQSKKNIVTGWLEGASGHELSDLGYAKFDILGLNNLQVVNDALNLIKKRHNKEITTEYIDSNLDDPFVYENIVKAGDHYGVFQFESNVSARTLNLIKPDKFSELSDISALIRPGTLMMGIPEMYADRKFGRPDENDRVWSIDDVPPSIRHILKDTYGLMVYQEQMMKIAEFAGGMDKGETNQLRRLIVKFGKLGTNDPKFINNIKYYYDKFIQNASRSLEEGGLGGKMEAQEMWDLMAAFSSYAFNKCIYFDEKVQDKVRGEITLQEVENLILSGEKVEIKSADEDGKDIWVEVIDVHNNGEKELVEVEMEDGRKIRCTIDHKFQTSEGMIPLEEIISRNLDIIMEE